jgi:hypothetical protein
MCHACSEVFCRLYTYPRYEVISNVISCGSSVSEVKRLLVGIVFPVGVGFFSMGTIKSCKNASICSIQPAYNHLRMAEQVFLKFYITES